MGYVKVTLNLFTREFMALLSYADYYLIKYEEHSIRYPDIQIDPTT